MKRTSLLAASFILLALMAVSALAQVPAAGAGKIGWIDTGAFALGDGTGITKYVNAVKAVEIEMKPRVTELTGLQTRLKTLSDDLAKMQSNPAVPVKPEAALAKQEEGQRLQREFEFKKKEYDAAVDSRSSQLLAPIQADIGKAIEDFAKSKGFAVILDIDKLGQAGVILALDPTANLTKDFIVFYNARPASATASTGAPR
ncbi:MAG TPA: OmpH family outer membrane protein [Pyrinomonadaceae bacterium]|jgi:Skp family chaperone for outer membrane proteins|nr:OmpH family outer membrane protein [Pyrinomonadaceae bacterium]